ncbi:hypothetical protein ACLKA7_011693 [Drosophila subpalustris]
MERSLVRREEQRGGSWERVAFVVGEKTRVLRQNISNLQDKINLNEKLRGLKYNKTYTDAAPQHPQQMYLRTLNTARDKGHENHSSDSHKTALQRGIQAEQQTTQHARGFRVSPSLPALGAAAGISLPSATNISAAVDSSSSKQPTSAQAQHPPALNQQNTYLLNHTQAHIYIIL